jgi:hypothetical protein
VFKKLKIIKNRKENDDPLRLIREIRKINERKVKKHALQRFAEVQIARCNAECEAYIRHLNANADAQLQQFYPPPPPPPLHAPAHLNWLVRRRL